MENQVVSPPHVDASRPSIGFPLGTALLLIIIFSLSGIFSFCYHLDKLRSLRRSFADGSHPDADIETSLSRPTPGFEAKPKPELACINAGRPDPKVHSITMSMSTSTARQVRSKS
ncbi:uncharacterized protein At5g65660-like [Hibiscus syriacus]|uniref:uncharacterized protein At5g65660-like n=1 Tax=Hibiscus syriacus TaxID=106335 RepID=UPI001924F977|nr:uncharacterized protein At5g65660-like [Hibiscus syriacus]